MRITKSSSGLNRLTLLAASLLACCILPANASPSAEVPGICSALEFEGPTGESVGLLGLRWEMSLEDVGEVLGKEIPQPVQIDTLEDFSARIEKNGRAIHVSANELDGHLSKVMVIAEAAGDYDSIEDCVEQLGRAPSEIRVFRGQLGETRALRWRDQETIVSLLLEGNREVINIARLPASSLQLPQERVDSLEPGEHFIVEWRGAPVVVARRSESTINALRKDHAGASSPGATTFQWLRAETSPAFSISELPHKALRSLTPDFAVYELYSPEFGCTVKVVEEEGALKAFHDPCRQKTFDLSGRSTDGTVALSVPVHRFGNEDRARSR